MSGDLLDHLPGELLLPAAFVLQPAEQLIAGELLHEVDGEDPVLPVVHRPLDADRVGQGGVELAERSDVHWLGRPSWLHVGFVGGYGVW